MSKEAWLKLEVRVEREDGEQVVRLQAVICVAGAAGLEAARPEADNGREHRSVLLNVCRKRRRPSRSAPRQSHSLEAKSPEC